MTTNIKNEDITYKPISTLYSKYPLEDINQTQIIDSEMLEKS